MFDYIQPEANGVCACVCMSMRNLGSVCMQHIVFACHFVYTHSHVCSVLFVFMIEFIHIIAVPTCVCL